MAESTSSHAQEDASSPTTKVESSNAFCPASACSLGTPFNDDTRSKETSDSSSETEGHELETVSGHHPILPMDVEGLLMETNGLLGNDKQSPDSVLRRRELRRLKQDRKAEMAAKPKLPKVRPNAFVAVRIRSSIIREGLEEVQQDMVRGDKRMSKLLVSLDKLHITLMVMRLDTPALIATAIEALNAAASEVSHTFNGAPLVLKMTGLGTFGSRVLFAHTTREGEEQLKDIASIVAKVFKNHSINSTDKRKFNPHLTVAKVTDNTWRVAKSIPPRTYESHVRDLFGDEVISELELLSMTEPKDDEGYYHCYHKVPFALKGTPPSATDVDTPNTPIATDIPIATNTPVTDKSIPTDTPTATEAHADTPTTDTTLSNVGPSISE